LLELVRIASRPAGAQKEPGYSIVVIEFRQEPENVAIPVEVAPNPDLWHGDSIPGRFDSLSCCFT
jgi:hypothetical protein